MTEKPCQIGKQGQVLYRIFCRDCNSFHPQYRYPCTNEKCEYGKVAVQPLGYKICPICKGNEYINE